jgi:hypothetical protein
VSWFKPSNIFRRFEYTHFLLFDSNDFKCTQISHIGHFSLLPRRWTFCTNHNKAEAEREIGINRLSIGATLDWHECRNKKLARSREKLRGIVIEKIVTAKGKLDERGLVDHFADEAIGEMKAKMNPNAECREVLAAELACLQQQRLREMWKGIGNLKIGSDEHGRDGDGNEGGMSKEEPSKEQQPSEANESGDNGSSYDGSSDRDSSDEEAAGDDITAKDDRHNVDGMSASERDAFLKKMLNWFSLYNEDVSDPASRLGITDKEIPDGTLPAYGVSGLDGNPPAYEG